mmetsp:Transcript_9173/g.16908  ORF Transcript_9173/g.16908 Transcript_9173/m.16908 type:complete len:209 (+) Transcript_9173:833-1459(+)
MEDRESECYLVRCYHCCPFRNPRENKPPPMTPFEESKQYFRVDPFLKNFAGFTPSSKKDVVDKDMEKKGRYVGEHVVDKGRSGGPDAFSNLLMAWGRFNEVIGAKFVGEEKTIEIKKEIYTLTTYTLITKANKWCKDYTINEFDLSNNDDTKIYNEGKERVAFMFNKVPHFHEDAKDFDDADFSKIDAAMNELTKDSKHCVNLKGPTT